MNEKLIDSEEFEIRKIISYDEMYEIPLFQRDYSWTDENVEEFMSDLINHLHEKPNRQYYFGTIFLGITNDRYKYIVVDGQQRLTTIMIFLIVVRDLYKKCECESGADMIDKYLYQDKKKLISRLHLNKRDNDFFMINILNRYDGSTKRIIYERNSKLENAYNKIERILIDEIEKCNKTEYLEKISDHLLKNFIVTINKIQPDDRYRIFDSVNNRGLKLSENDFVKNTLFEMIELNNEDEEYCHDKWLKMSHTIEDMNINPNKFLRDYLIAYHEKVSKKKVSQTIINTVRNHYKSPTILIEKLYESSINYANMIFPGIKFEKHPITKKNLEILRMLDSKSIYSVLLIGYDIFPRSKDFEELTDILVKFFFRSRTICHSEANSIETVMAEVCLKLRKKESMKDIRSYIIGEKIYHKSDFVDNFKLFSTNHDNIALYILSTISDKLSGSAQSSFDVHLHHIMPTTLNVVWKTYLKNKLPIQHDQNIEEDHKTNIHKIGNMTLLEDSLSDISNDQNMEYAHRLNNYYNKSNIEITKKISEHKDWLFVDIKEHQSFLASHANLIWTLDH